MYFCVNEMWCFIQRRIFIQSFRSIVVVDTAMLVQTSINSIRYRLVCYGIILTYVCTMYMQAVQSTPGMPTLKTSINYCMQTHNICSIQFHIITSTHRTESLRTRCAPPMHPPQSQSSSLADIISLPHIVFVRCNFPVLLPSYMAIKQRLK